jgi:hypothetical protein
MNESMIVILVTVIITMGFFALLMMWAFRQERHKTELAHAERKMALERGMPLPDAEVARCKALAWIGATVPVASLGVPSGVTMLLVPPRLSEPSVVALVAVWMACGSTAVVGVSAVVLRLRQYPDSSKIATAQPGES